MTTNRMIVEERQRDIGQFLVGRLLPFRKKRQVGPFTFIDHMGPVSLGPERYFDIDQHPHIGLSTLTYLLEGYVEHRDSTGAVQIISPGDVGFMTAGRGVTHTERTPAGLRDGQQVSMHGYQIWVAMPRELEQMEPRFDFVPSAALPEWKEQGIRYRLVAGTAMGHTSPLPVHSPLYMLDLDMETSSELDLGGKLPGEFALVVVSGAVHEAGETIAAGSMMVAKSRLTCRMACDTGTRLLIFGGEPFPEERYLYWNFVSSSKETIEDAKKRWAGKAFPQVPGDDSYIPLP